jgi:hypothetical protein
LEGVEILPMPYVWIPWTGADVRPANTQIARRSTTIDPYQLYSHLTWVPFMGAAEFRSGQLGLVVDNIHAPLKAGFAGRQILFGGGTETPTIDAGTATFFYRPIASPLEYVDVGLGVRAWGLAGGISLNQGLLPPANVTTGLAWADPLIAARYHRDLGNGYSATLSGDFGGFGIGAHFDWQLVATIDYAWNSSVELHGGFRTLNFSYGASRANIQLNMYGPILAATLRF